MANYNIDESSVFTEVAADYTVILNGVNASRSCSNLSLRGLPIIG